MPAIFQLKTTPTRTRKSPPTFFFLFTSGERAKTEIGEFNAFSDLHSASAYPPPLSSTSFPSARFQLSRPNPWPICNINPGNGSTRKFANCGGHDRKLRRIYISMLKKNVWGTFSRFLDELVNCNATPMPPRGILCTAPSRYAPLLFSDSLPFNATPSPSRVWYFLSAFSFLSADIFCGRGMRGCFFYMEKGVGFSGDWWEWMKCTGIYFWRDVRRYSFVEICRRLLLRRCTEVFFWGNLQRSTFRKM